jgi:DNA-binding GntR family transcriptional regulator
MDALPSPDAPRRQLSQDVASYVRELIISGRVREGEFLRIDAIARAMSVSSTPVREGLLLLQLEGFVRLSPRRGFAVVGFSRQDVRDIFWAQAVLAGELAARAAAVITDDEAARLRGLMEAHAAAVEADDEPRYTRLAHQFHRTVNLAAKSPRLAILLGTMTKQLPNTFYGKTEGRVQSSLDDHPGIFEAIVAGDGETARDRMREHIVAGGDVLVAYLEEQGLWSEAPVPGEPARAAE